MTFMDYLVNNFDMIYSLVGIVILSILSVHIPRKMKIFTFVSIGLLFVETVCFHLEQWSQTFETLSFLRPMMTATLYSIYPLIIIFMTRMTETKHIRLRFWILMIPELLSIPMFYTSQWSRVVFYFTEDNHYKGGPLAWWPYILFGFYAVIFVISNLMYLKKQSKTNRIAIEYIVIGSVAGVILYLVTDSGKDYNSLFATAILMYYTFMYIHMAKIDPLTSLLNRQCFTKDMESFNRSVTGIVSADMNYLKYYNDYIGHDAGDNALVTVSEIMRDYCGKGGIPYRVGGDEFVIIYSNTSEEEIKNAIVTMQEQMEKTEYMCAFGYAMKKPIDSMYDALKVSDEMMYVNKNLIKKEHPFEEKLKNRYSYSMTNEPKNGTEKKN